MMARKRDQEDVFKPLNDSPADVPEQPHRSGRGWEIKLGLGVLLLFVGVTGYVAYTQFMPGEDAEEVAAGPSRLDLGTDAGEVTANQVVPAVAQAQFNDDAQPERPMAAGAWNSAESVADQVPEPLDATTTQSYAANYANDPYPAPKPTESTFAPMPNPDGFAAGATTPISSAPSPGPIQENAYGNQIASELQEQTSPGQWTGQPEAATPTPPAGEAQFERAGNSSVRGYDFRASPQPDFPPSASALTADNPAAPPTVSQYESAAPPTVSQHEPSVPPYTPPQQHSYAGAATATPDYAASSSITPPSQEPYPSYPPATTTKTHAEYAGQFGSSVADEKPASESWQRPTVVPVDGKYTAQPNDNFYTISQNVYGSGAYFEALAKYNKDKYPKANQIRIGDIVQAPPVETLEGRYPELCPKPEHRDAAKQRSAALSSRSLAGRRVYVVQEGDNLFDIARFELGARSKVAELIQLNRDVLGNQINYLTPGMRLVLPETGGQSPRVTQGPTNSLR